MRAPFPPLAPGGDGLDTPPAPPHALRRRMAEVYGVAEDTLLPVRGAAHGQALLQRLAQTGLTIVDESGIEFTEMASRCSEAAANPELVVLRDLGLAYGLMGAPCGAIIAHPELIKQLAAISEPAPLSTPTVRLAEAVLHPSRMALSLQRIEEVKGERVRIATALSALRDVIETEAGAGPFISARFDDTDAALARLRQFGVAADLTNAGAVRLPVGLRHANAALLAALGADADTAPARRATLVRDTKETRIAVALDLDTPAPPSIDTGIGFFDHMLTQIAHHGGFALTLTCAGDLEIDAHHTIEDCALAVGQALNEALGARRGISRFGYVVPMDETLAQVAVDLSGRPYCVFEGVFSASHIGAYPTQMTEHVFRSLAQALGASINVSVTGDNDHHKTEACFKALGRALRTAIRIEGDAIPSTKGVL